MTTAIGIMGKHGLIRYSAIIRHLELVGHGVTVAQFVTEVDGAGRRCSLHGVLTDPVILVEPTLAQLIVACPWCSGDDVRAEWEDQAVADV